MNKSSRRSISMGFTRERQRKQLKQEIDELKKIRNDLRHSETKYRTIFEQSPDAIVIIDPASMEIVEFNDQAASMLGYTREAFSKLKIPDFETAETIPEIKSHTAAVLSKGEDLFETKMKTRDGQLKDVLVSIRVVEIDGKRVFHNIFHDITDRKFTEEKLRVSELWMRNIFKSLDECVLVVTPDRKLSDVNETTERVFGYEKSELTNQSTDILHVDSKHYKEFSRRINAAFNEGKSAHFEFVAKTKNGEIFPTEHTVSELKDDAGEAVGIVSIVRDITEKKQMEEKLQENEKRLRLVIKGSSDAPWDWDLITNDLYYSPQWWNQIGYNPDELPSDAALW